MIDELIALLQPVVGPPISNWWTWSCGPGCCWSPWTGRAGLTSRP